MVGRSIEELAALVGGRLVKGQGGGPRIEDVTHDSRQVTTRSLFVAIEGLSRDGHQFVTEAVASGAAAICVRREMPVEVPQVVVADTRPAMGMLAAAVHGDPSHALSVVGVTGTNGKTTVTHYVESIAGSSGVTPGLIGTIGVRIAGEPTGSMRTTPEATDFQRLLARMRDAGCRLVAAEVSSHALALDRVRGTRFEVAAFTNLSQDHLDFHGDMDRYLAAKRSLFEEYEVGTAVINVADPAGVVIAREFRGSLIRVGPGGDGRAEEIAPTPGGTRFRLVTPWGETTVSSTVTGRFNVENVVIATVSSVAAGIGFDRAVAALETLPGVPGRFEKVSGDDPVAVIVDYAHTPDGIVKAIATAREMTAGRVIAMAGAGGDRDRDKRPMMGEALSAADLAVVTSDNPRSEAPESIVAEVVAGIPPGTASLVDVDRRRAIEMALGEAASGDVVLLLGRGHEPFQEVGGEMIEFDDRQVASAALIEMRRSANSRAGPGSMSP